ncbi:uncharacterized protein M421DRAFT_248341 [Didymella exigua CBS 183.55]|uniref:Uncharacterized protein n=1 Tax=Didymella exigua CBS 183.55 TaxID=1150837 RepID=A0A6A5S2N7_9PLEO|nr:uncharacterized protein M421DRAFT_248341 [Didymella exigua CBS 183.55]KAF1932736.1 hypothetical protein M421DRAFT_248341 [Didymella exigua CBS 183.55]
MRVKFNVMWKDRPCRQRQGWRPLISNQSRDGRARSNQAPGLQQNHGTAPLTNRRLHYSSTEAPTARPQQRNHPNARPDVDVALAKGELQQQATQPCASTTGLPPG